MRALIAATCIAVLAAVGYYFWGEYSRYADQQAQAAEQVRLRNIDDRAHVSGPECRQYASSAIAANGGVDDQTSRRLRLCIKTGEIWPFDRDELKRVGLFDEYASN